MKRFIIVVLLLCLSLLTFSACDTQKETPDEPVKTEQGAEIGNNDNTNGNAVDDTQGGGETENDGSEESKPKRTPVQPISDGGKINFN